MKRLLQILTVSVTAWPLPLASNELVGAWSEVFDWPVTAIHMSLLHTGHVVLWSDDGEFFGHGEPWLLDPTNECFAYEEDQEGNQIDTCFVEKENEVNVFCGGHAQLDDGSLLVNGGHIANDIGVPDTFLFEYDRELDDWNWTARGALPDSHHTRWYSTLTTLPDGRVLNVSGSERRCASGPLTDELCTEHSQCGPEEDLQCTVRLVAEPEVFDPATRLWTLLEGIQDPVQYYPFNFVAPSGDVFFSGADVGAETIYDPSSTDGLYFDVDGDSLVPTNQSSLMDGGSAVMFRPGRILKCGGTPSGGGGSQATAETIDLNVSDAWTEIDPMNVERRRHNTTLLPDGTVLVTGGTRRGNLEFEIDGRCDGIADGTICPLEDGCPNEGICEFVPSGEQQWVAEAEIWDPDTGDWTVMAGNQTPRLYHSSALLLPDGRVISAGGGPRGFGGALNTYSDAEIFSPPYLFRDSERPVIDEVPEIIYYGNSFEMVSEQAHDVAAVNLIRLGAVTHSFDQNTRFVPLSFAEGLDDRLDVQAPPNANIAPPGYYMVFLVSSDGVPSVARFVRILQPDPGADALYEYSAKIVCGVQEEDYPATRTPGHYATSVNIHNPLRTPVRFFQKLALTSPPGRQVPGNILPIGELVLDYDAALQTDCHDLRRELISTAEAATIEGFLVIQSPAPLDVTSVYSSAAMPQGTHSSIDVETVPERRRPTSDIAVSKNLIPCPEPEFIADAIEISPCDYIYNTGGIRVGYSLRLFEIVLTNNGPDLATGPTLADELELVFDPAQAVGATVIWTDDPIDLPAGALITVQQPSNTRSLADITLPDLPAGQNHTVRFWTISMWASPPTVPVTLDNNVTAETTTLDQSPLNDVAAVSVGLNP